jgi:hypothetical protein
MKQAFGAVGSAGGHGSMAKAVIPVAEIARVWEVDPRAVRPINERAQREFLKALHDAR